jgi:hypothetical protein
MKLVAYVFANPTRQTYVHFDDMGYVSIVDHFPHATIFPPERMAEYTRLLVMSHITGFELAKIYVE